MSDTIKTTCIAKKSDGTTCNFKPSDECGGKYCMKHKFKWLEEQDGGNNVSRCNSRTNCDPNKPGIKAILPPGYLKKKCESCLQRERDKDKELRKKRCVNNINAANKICPECGKQFPKEQSAITSRGQESNYCKECFTKRQLVELNRQKRERGEYYKTYENRPETKIIRQNWKEENPDKTACYSIEYRARELKENPEEYRKRNAEVAKKYRENNPEYLEKRVEQRKTDVETLYKMYIRACIPRGYKMELSLEEFGKLVSQNCYYCGIKGDKYLLGIDRVDNSKGYIQNNVVTCCTKCNNMKNSLTESTFILMCASIAHQNKMFTSKLYDVFNYYKIRYYNEYKKRASKKNISFELTESEFTNFTKNTPCYICKQMSPTDSGHGIDRFDNSKGYVVENCRTCCGDCNYLKKDLKHDEFLFQCKLIAENNKDRLDILEKKWTRSKFGVANLNKLELSPEEKLLQKKIQDKIRHEKTMESKTPEAIEKKKEEIRLKKLNQKQ